MKFPNLSQAEILAISKALADTEYGFTGSELEVLLKQYDFADENPTMTKYKRLYNSFVERYNREKSCNSIYMFIQKCMDPARGLVDEEKYAKRRMETNKILMLKGIEIDDGGNFRTVQKAQGVSEVTRRTREQENLGRSYMDMEHINMFFNVVKRNYWQRIIFMQYKRLPRVCVTEYVR